MGCSLEKIQKMLFAFFVVIIFFISFTLPITMGADDTITVSFDPDGSVSIEVSDESHNYSTVTINGNEESDDFTIWNNGTIAATVVSEANKTSDEQDLELDGDGTPGTNFFSLRFTTTTLSGADAYISNTSSSQTTLESSLAASGSDTFRITVYIGYTSSDPSWQTILVNFTGSAAS